MGCIAEPKFVTASSMQSLVNKAEKPAMLQGRVCENFGLCDCTVDCTGLGFGNAKNANIVGKYACLISWVHVGVAEIDSLSPYFFYFPHVTHLHLSPFFPTSLYLLLFTAPDFFLGRGGGEICPPPPMVFLGGERGRNLPPPQIMPCHP